MVRTYPTPRVACKNPSLKASNGPAAPEWPFSGQNGPMCEHDVHPAPGDVARGARYHYERIGDESTTDVPLSTSATALDGGSPHVERAALPK